jgi:hypothetical protein
MKFYGRKGDTICPKCHLRPVFQTDMNHILTEWLLRQRTACPRIQQNEGKALVFMEPFNGDSLSASGQIARNRRWNHCVSDQIERGPGRRAQHSIRINDQWRIRFVWKTEGP